MIEPSKGRVVFFVTGNVHKFNEARRVLSEHKIATAMLKTVGVVEIQDDTIENVAKASAVDAVKKCDLPIVVEDSGLFIEALNGFPGPYSSYVYRTIDNDGVLKLMEDTVGRNAYFKSVVAFLSPSMDEPSCFIGSVKGKIATERRGSQGFGFDPIFQPINSSKTFATMTVEEKNQHSHRALAFHVFAEWFAASS